MTPDPDLSRWAAETMQAHPGLGPFESITEHSGGKQIQWPPSWVEKLNRQMKEAAE